jgi:hypothetical protein
LAKFQNCDKCSKNDARSLDVAVEQLLDLSSSICKVPYFPQQQPKTNNNGPSAYVEGADHVPIIGLLSKSYTHDDDEKGVSLGDELLSAEKCSTSSRASLDSCAECDNNKHGMYHT